MFWGVGVWIISVEGMLWEGVCGRTRLTFSRWPKLAVLIEMCLAPVLWFPGCSAMSLSSLVTRFISRYVCLLLINIRKRCPEASIYICL